MAGKAPTRQDLADLAGLIQRGAISTDPADLNDHAYDWWPLSVKRAMLGSDYVRPAAVVWPADTAEVQEIVAWAHRRAVALVPTGGRSSVVGGATAVDGAVTLDMQRMNRIAQLDEDSCVVSCETGVLGVDLERFLNERGYTLGHYPQSLELSTVGGWLSTRASGTFSTRYGGIEALIVGLRGVTADAERFAFESNPRAATGPDLRHLFIGAEGTLAILTEADLAVQRMPERRALRALRFPELAAGLEAIRELVQVGVQPALIRLYDDAEAAWHFGDAHLPGSCLLLLGWDGPAAIIDEFERLALDLCVRRFGGHDLGRELAEQWYAKRYDVTAVREGSRVAGRMLDTIEVSMIWKNAELCYHALQGALAKHCARVYGHFSHAYQSGVSLYAIFEIEAANDEEALRLYELAWAEAMGAAVAAEAAISHHHGIGVVRLPWMAARNVGTLPLLARVKTALDPANIFNPGKLIPEQ